MSLAPACGIYALNLYQPKTITLAQLGPPARNVVDE